MQSSPVPSSPVPAAPARSDRPAGPATPAGPAAPARTAAPARPGRPRTLALADLPGALRAIVGPRPHWWTVESPFEVLVGCVLVQNTNWRNVERSLDLLRGAGVTDPARLLSTDTPALVALVTPSGFQTAKAATLRGLCAWWVDEGGPDALPTAGLCATAPALEDVTTPDLRRELRALRGIGPETADVLMLYLLGRGVFVADTYARRVFTDLGWQVPRGYDAFAALVQDRLDLPLEGWQEFHALLDDVAKLRPRRLGDGQSDPLAGLVLQR